MKFRHIVLILGCLLIIYLCYLASKSKFVLSTIKQERVNFLLLGLDFVDNAVHADTAILINYSPIEKIVNIISIPRDTYVDIEEINYKKLTEIYAFYYLKTQNKYKSAVELIQCLQKNLFNKNDLNIEIPYFLALDYENFKNLMKTIGKVKIVIDKPMHYDDNAGNLHIHFDTGVVYLDSERALEYIRYRDKVGDIGRISRQQQFLKGVIENVRSPVMWYKLPKILYILGKSFITNINFFEFLSIILEFRNLEIKNFRFLTLTGKPEGRYIKLEKSSFDFLSKILLTTQLDTLREEKNNKDRFIIKIYNASNRPKLAKRLAMFLRDKGYDVLDWDNWYCKLPKSKILDYTCNYKLLDEISSLLNIYDIEAANIHKNFCLEEQIDVAIVLGDDFSLSY
ncbi:MAG: LCP family protein [Endomicrobia bacterium]|nr:LCP family protein [Endomicrobiia bacterium]